MSQLRIGRHINISGDFLFIPAYAESIGCDIFQIFLGSPQKVLSKARSKDELLKFGKELEKRKIDMVIHGSYTINLCHPTNTGRFQTSLRSLIQDLNASVNFGSCCLGVIIHMGKNIPENKINNEQALKNYVMGIKMALTATPKNTTIILETGASQGSEVGSKISELAKIYWNLNKIERERVKFCIDTCHIWATGYDISVPVGVRKFFDEFDNKIGIKKISCIHFNDSKTPLESHVDRHADIGYGYIGEKGLREVAYFAKRNMIPIIFETPLDTINKNTNCEITFIDEMYKIKKWLGLKAT